MARRDGAQSGVRACCMMLPIMTAMTAAAQSQSLHHGAAAASVAPPAGWTTQRLAYPIGYGSHGPAKLPGSFSNSTLGPCYAACAAAHAQHRSCLGFTACSSGPVGCWLYSDIGTGALAPSPVCDWHDPPWKGPPPPPPPPPPQPLPQPPPTAPPPPPAHVAPQWGSSPLATNVVSRGKGLRAGASSRCQGCRTRGYHKRGAGGARGQHSTT